MRAGFEASAGPQPFAAARDRFTDRLRNLALVSAFAFLTAFAAFFGFILYFYGAGVVASYAASKDISVFWAAGRLAVEGAPIGAFDLETLTAARDLPPDTPPANRRMIWSYPPHFHALVAPLGLLPMNLAWLSFAGLSVLAFGAALRALTPSGVAALLFATSPAALIAAIQGQNSLLVGALLAGFLAAHERRRHLLAGILLGLLTIKPQFGPLIPLALIAVRDLRTVAWASVTVVILVGLTLIWPGIDYWSAFLASLSETAEKLRIGWLPRVLMVNWYGFAVALGLPERVAWWMQLAIAGAIAVSLYRLWRRPGIPFGLKAAALMLAILLASPYGYFYDLVLGAIAGALILNASEGRAAAMVSSALALWLLPAAPLLLKVLTLPKAFPLLAAPVLSLCFAAVVRQTGVLRGPSEAPAANG